MANHALALTVYQRGGEISHFFSFSPRVKRRLHNHRIVHHPDNPDCPDSILALPVLQEQCYQECLVLRVVPCHLCHDYQQVGGAINTLP